MYFVRVTKVKNETYLRLSFDSICYGPVYWRDIEFLRDFDEVSFKDRSTKKASGDSNIGDSGLDESFDHDMLEVGDVCAGLVTEQAYNQLTSIIYRRAYNKSMSFLAVSEYCHEDIRFKLKQRGYFDVIIDDVIKDLYSQNHLNDARYAENYARTFLMKLSREQIMKDLGRKGISFSEDRVANIDFYKKLGISAISDIVDQAYYDEEIDDEDIIINILEKRFSGCNFKDPKSKNRILGYFQRRGFSLNVVNNYLT